MAYIMQILASWDQSHLRLTRNFTTLFVLGQSYTFHFDIKEQWLARTLMNVSYGLRLQPVDATHALNLSAGVSNPNVSRGRSFN